MRGALGRLKIKRNMERTRRRVRTKARLGARTKARLRARGRALRMENVSGMRLFAELAMNLGTSTKTNERLELLERYFSSAADGDKVWVIALFSGRRPKRTVNTTMLWEWCRELTGLPGWL